jgi:hypothetical protein
MVVPLKGMKHTGRISELRAVEAQRSGDMRATLEVFGSPPLAGPPGVAIGAEPGVEWEFITPIEVVPRAL